MREYLLILSLSAVMGCRAPHASGSGVWSEDRQVLAKQTTFFELGSSTLNAKAKTNATVVAHYMRTNTEVAVRIEGHGDGEGTEAQNLKLANRRARLSMIHLPMAFFGNECPGSLVDFMAHALDAGLRLCLIRASLARASEANRSPMRQTMIWVIAALLAGCASRSHQDTTVAETLRPDPRWMNAPPHKIERFPADVTINKDAGRGNFLFVTLRLESGEILPFSVDTGSPITVVDKSLESTLGKRLSTMPVGMVGHAQQQSGCYAAPELWLGDVPLQTGSNVWTYDFKQPRGILGMDCLKNYCIQLDFQSGKMRFLDSEHLDTAVLGKAFPLTLSRTGPQGKFVRPIIHHLGLVGENTNLLIDTGCRIDGLTERSAMWKVIWGRLLSSLGTGYLHSRAWDGESYTNIRIAPVADANVLGLRFLARHLVTLDFPGRTMYLKQTSVSPLCSVSDAHTAPAKREQNGEPLSSPRRQ